MCVRLQLISKKVRKEMSEDRIIEPTENDILMGRGGKNNQHVGNEKLRHFARGRCDDYRKAFKKRKSSISRELVQQVRDMNPPGRFLKKDSTSGLWEDVGDEVAREKASQALRDAASHKYDGPGSAVYPEPIIMSEEHVGIPRPQLHRRISSDPGIFTGEYSSESRKALMKEWRDETMIRPFASSDPPNPLLHHSSSGSRSTPGYSSSDYTTTIAPGPEYAYLLQEWRDETMLRPPSASAHPTQPPSHHASQPHSTAGYSSPDHITKIPAQDPEHHSNKRPRYTSDSLVIPPYRPTERPYDHHHQQYEHHEYRERQEWTYDGPPEHQP